jgi:uncharacterized protein YbjT (DUF2867 family)
MNSHGSSPLAECVALKVLVLGASGLVGANVLRLALAHPDIERVIAPTRKPLPPHEKLTNPVSDRLQLLVARVPEWAPDALICALGTTMGKAGSKAAFREVDYVLPLQFASAAKSSGARTLALVSSIGASVDSRFFYARTKGELERDVRTVGFQSLTIVRPSIIGGQRDELRLGEGVALCLSRVLGPILPKRFRISEAPNVAGALIDSVIAGLPGCHFRLAESLL